MKRKSDIRIGQRAYSEICRLFPMFLARLLQLGADIEWILTGK